MHVLQQIAVVHCFFSASLTSRSSLEIDWNYSCFLCFFTCSSLQLCCLSFRIHPWSLRSSPSSCFADSPTKQFLHCLWPITKTYDLWFQMYIGHHWTSLDIIGHHWTSFHYSQIFPGVHPIHSIVPEASHASHVRLHGQNNWNPPTRCKKGVWRDDSSSNTNNTSHATNNGSELRRRYNKLAGVSW